MIKKDKKQYSIEASIKSDSIGVENFKKSIEKYKKLGWVLDGDLILTEDGRYVQKLYKDA